MINEEIADVFEKMARVLAFKGEDRFRTLAYERAARSLRDLEEDLRSIAQAGKLDDIPGIGRDLSEMIEEYIKTRRISRFERERRGMPDELIELMSIPGIGPKTLALLHKKFRIKDFESLKRLIDSGALLKLRGFGERKLENIRRGISLWLASKQRLPLGVALPLAERLLGEIRKNELIEKAEAAGSIRRRRETIGDIDVVITSKDGPQALRELSRLPMVEQVIAIGPTKASLIIEGGIQVDIRAVAKESFGAAVFHRLERAQRSLARDSSRSRAEG